MVRLLRLPDLVEHFGRNDEGCKRKQDLGRGCNVHNLDVSLSKDMIETVPPQELSGKYHILRALRHTPALRGRIGLDEAWLRPDDSSERLQRIQQFLRANAPCDKD